MTKGSDSGKAPREFWLYDNGEEPFLAYYGLDYLKADTSARPNRIIHVIEKSAFDRLAQELALVKAAKDVPTTNTGWPHEKKLLEELVALHDEIDAKDQIIAIYEKALKEYAPMEEWYESFADQNGSLGKIAQDALTEAATLKSQHKP